MCIEFLPREVSTVRYPQLSVSSKYGTRSGRSEPSAVDKTHLTLKGPDVVSTKTVSHVLDTVDIRNQG